MAVTLIRPREEEDINEFELENVTKPQKETKGAHAKENKKLRQKRVEKVFARRVSAREVQSTLDRRCDAAMCWATLTTAERDSAN